MKIKKVDKKNRFISVFDTETGVYYRTGVLNEKGEDSNIDPFMTEFPELIDIGIMSSCIHGKKGLCKKSGVQCYQNGFKVHKPNMGIEDFKSIINQIKGKTYQVALGGRGDVNKHESFEEILKLCRDNGVVPNYTTSGFDITEEEVAITRRYCGAVAVSEYRHEHTRRSINMFLKSGMKTNIHYVLGNNTIDEAITKLKNNDFDKGVNAVVFLLHKPIGQGQLDNVLNINDPRVKEFYNIIDDKEFDFKIGFDSCNVPALVNMTKNINKDSFDTCEAGRWSCYIDAEMNIMPCSFDNEALKWAISLKENTIKEAWDSEKFEEFRNSFRNSCTSCKEWIHCKGGCPISREIVLCKREGKTLWQK